MPLKPIGEQVIVITGASSGIGLATARMAARAGAKLVLTARSEETLIKMVEVLESQGHAAIAVPADVTSERELRRVAEAAKTQFGGFDTWVNVAGLTIYGPLDQTDIEDQRRLFDINYWGVVHGSMVAAEHLRDKGGAIINMGSILSDIPAPYQGTYSATKHAVKAFTSTLRMELESEGAPISVTLIKPGTIDTPFVEHGKNLLPGNVRNPPPAYAPEVVARAILNCAEHPRREVVVGGSGRLGTLFHRLAPGLSERMLGRTKNRIYATSGPAHPREDYSDGLYQPVGEGQERSANGSSAMRHSLYTHARLHPSAVTTAAVLVLGATAVAFALRKHHLPALEFALPTKRYARHAMNYWPF